MTCLIPLASTVVSQRNLSSTESPLSVKGKAMLPNFSLMGDHCCGSKGFNCVTWHKSFPSAMCASTERGPLLKSSVNPEWMCLSRFYLLNFLFLLSNATFTSNTFGNMSCNATWLALEYFAHLTMINWVLDKCVHLLEFSATTTIN